MATKSKLEKMLNDALLEAVSMRKRAEREAVEPSEIAKAYENAIVKVTNYCKERNRY